MIYKVGDKVRFIDAEARKIYPGRYPDVGTVGEVVYVDQDFICNEAVAVEWPGEESPSWCAAERVEPAEAETKERVEPAEAETKESRPETKIELIRWPTDENWMLAYEAALITIGKVPMREPSDAWKRKILRARHSPIRELKFVFRLTNVPYWVAGHLVRHIHAQPYVGSQRNDRQNKYDRNAARQDAPVDMLWSMEAEELITIANKRLCMKAAAETREVVEQMCVEVLTRCPEFADELVPMCERNGGVCYEFASCGRCEK